MLSSLAQDHQRQLAEELEEGEDKFRERLESKPDINQKDIDNLIRRYEADVEDYESIIHCSSSSLNLQACRSLSYRSETNGEKTNAG